jgi:predicted ester cyclase
MTNSCQQTTATNDNDFEQAVRSEALAYFETFAERSDWDKFCSFYREDVHFKDITAQLDLDSLWKLKMFYQWEDERGRFEKIYPEQKHLNLQTLVVEGSTVAAKGHFNPFYYNGTIVDPEWGMEFTIWLRFDENLKIFEQIDWMEYDPFTLENIIIRCRENGFEAIPDWLDLSKKEYASKTTVMYPCFHEV